MIPTTLDALLAAVDGELQTAPPDAATLTFESVVTDSRLLGADAGAARPAPMFIALPAKEADGHTFVGDAIAGGARAVIVDRDVPVPQHAAVVRVADTWQALRSLARDVRDRVNPDVVAITGSLGKTTVKDLAAAALGTDRRVHAAHGSFNNELGVPLTLLGLEADHQLLVTELGARHAGDIRALADVVAPDVAVVTAVAGVHLEIFGSIETIARTKGELVDALGPGGTAVLNVADPCVAAMAARAPAALGVAADDPTADVHARAVTADRHARVRATAVTPWGRTELVLPIAGRHHLTNGLLALAVAGHLGVDLDAAAAAIATAPISPWRGAVVELDGVTVLDDAYNANPAAMDAALQTLVTIERTGATVAVLGAMGEIGPASAQEHQRIGRRCAELEVDQVVVVGAAAAPIAQGARDAGHRDVTEVADADAGAAHLDARVQAGDVVLVKASRAAGLERITEQLRERRKVAAPEVGR